MKMIITLLIIALPMFASASSSEFPYQTGDLRWSRIIVPTDGRASLGMTNGCVKLNALKQPTSDRSGYILDRESCTGGSDGLVTLAHSEAAAACAKIGGHLPSKSELEQLIRSFNHTEDSQGPRLTYAGEGPLKNAFDFYTDDTQFYQFLWSSSVGPSYSQDHGIDAYFFDGEAINLMNRFKDGPSVRCVQGR